MNSQWQENQHYNISQLKLAVAIAILRIKPPELSGREYTEMLQTQYLSSGSLLQDQHQQRKMQILQLQQQNLEKTVPLQDKDTPSHAVVLPQTLNNISGKTSASSNSYPNGTDVCLESSQPETTNMSPNHSEARKEIPANCEMLTPVLQQENTAKVGDTLLSVHEADDFRDVRMLENYRFMHSVIELQGLANQKPGLETDRLLKSACTHISTLRSVISHDVLILSESCMCEGAESVVMVTDCVPWIGDRPEFMQEVCSLVECVIAKLVQTSSSGQAQVFSQKRVLMKMLLIFMKGKMLPLLCCILDSLVESVEIFCQKLKASQLRSEAVDPDLFENGYYIINCLELIMKIWAKDNRVHASILQEAQEKLDRFLLQVAHCFPLVAQALSRITSLIEVILRNR